MAWKEEWHDARGFAVGRVVNGAWLDLRLAARRLRATPLFLLFASVSLAVGVGVTTTTYSVLAAMLWPSPGIAGAGRLVFVSTPTRYGPGWRSVMSRSDFDALHSAQRSCRRLAASAAFAQSLVGQDVSQIVEGEAVSGEYFDTLGIGAVLGRTIQPVDDARATPVVVLGHRTWRTRFAGDPAIVGRFIRLGGQSFQVVGVAPASFDGLAMSPGRGSSAWIPLGAISLFPSARSRAAAEAPEPRNLSVVGRLAPTSTPAMAAVELSSIALRLDRAFPLRMTQHDTGAITVQPRRWSARRASEVASDPNGSSASRMRALILCLVALVLVVACTNLANLMLARGTLRAHEFAVRRALGASRWQLVRLQLAEGAILTALGAAGAFGVTRTLSVLATVDIPVARGFLHLEPRLSVPAVIVAASALVVSMVVVGLEPALHLTNTDHVSADLASEGGTGGAPRTRRHRRLIRWQVAVATCFFLIAAVLARVVIGETRHDSGIAFHELALVTVHPEGQGWNEMRARQVVDSALRQARATRQVMAVAASSGVPFGMTMTSWAQVTTPEKPFVAGRPADMAAVIAATPDIFATLGVPILRGRAFDERDTFDAPRTMVIAERTARGMFGTADAVGRQVMIRMWGWRPLETFTVVGVSRDTDTERLTWRRGALMYIPLAQHYEPNLVLLARARDPAAGVRVLQSALRRADPDLATGTAGTGVQLLSGAFVMAPVAAVLAAALSAVTLILAMVGLYGIESHLVAWRTRELGVRVTLGAARWQLERMVIREGARPVVEGVVIGLVLGAIARLAIRAIVAAPIQIIDPLAFALVPVPLFAAALVACYLPARRAARVDPNVALRHL
jgi:putative ABC transport system permease protein